MPSSLTEDRSSTLGCLPLPTSVGVRYGRCNACPLARTARGFSWRPGHHAPSDASAASPVLAADSLRSGFAWISSPHRTTTPVHSGGGRFLSRPPFTICSAPVQEFRTCSPSPTPPHSQRPRLRIRLTLGRLPLPRNPQASGVAGFNYRHSRYSFRHSRLWALHQPSRSGFSAPHNAPLPCRLDSCTKRIRGFGGLLEPRYVVGAGALDQ